MSSERKNSSVVGLVAALSEGVRLRILCLLEEAAGVGEELSGAEELSVGEVTSVLQLPQSTVSRHLKVLAEAGWVTRRAAGTATFYRLVPGDLSEAARSVWATLRGEMEETAEVREDARRLRDVLAERRLDSQAFFGRVAGEWDEVRGHLFGADFTARALLSLLPREWVVADLGCGTGNVSELLAPCVERIYAVDQSEPMLEAARKRLGGGGGAGNVEFLAGSLERLPLGDGSVDAAVCVLVLHHVPDPAAALREMRRVVRNERGGGTVLIVDMLEHGREEYRPQMGHIHLGFAPETMGRMLREAGFAGARVDLLPVDTGAKGPGLFVATGRI